MHLTQLQWSHRPSAVDPQGQWDHRDHLGPLDLQVLQEDLASLESLDLKVTEASQGKRESKDHQAFPDLPVHQGLASHPSKPGVMFFK